MFTSKQATTFLRCCSRRAIMSTCPAISTSIFMRSAVRTGMARNDSKSWKLRRLVSSQSEAKAIYMETAHRRGSYKDRFLRISSSSDSDKSCSGSSTRTPSPSTTLSKLWNLAFSLAFHLNPGFLKSLRSLPSASSSSSTSSSSSKTSPRALTGSDQLDIRVWDKRLAHGRFELMSLLRLRSYSCEFKEFKLVVELSTEGPSCSMLKELGR